MNYGDMYPLIPWFSAAGYLFLQLGIPDEIQVPK